VKEIMSAYASEPGLDMSIVKSKGVGAGARLLGISANPPAGKYKGDSGNQFVGRVT
jgi:hypothetical protein